MSVAWFNNLFYRTVQVPVVITISDKQRRIRKVVYYEVKRRRF